MFDLNNNNDNEDNKNNIIPVGFDWTKSIDGFFRGLENERDKYKKELECVRMLAQKLDDEKFVLHKTMDRLMMVCREGKKTIDRANRERNEIRKLAFGQPKGVHFIEQPHDDFYGFNAVTVAAASTSSATGASSKQILSAKKSDDSSTVAGSTMPKRKSDGVNISPVPSSKKRKIIADKKKRTKTVKRMSTGGKKMP